MIAIYARVSTAKQKDNYSLPVQRTKGITFADSLKEDYVIYEEAVSGATLIARSELERLLQDIQNGIIKKVWVIELTRLSRSVEDFQIIIRMFTEHHVELFVNDIQTDLSKIDHRFLFNIDAAVSEFERERLIQRVKRNIDERRDSGKLHIPPCLGYELQYDENGNREYVISKSEAKIVTTIFYDYRNGSSLNKIAIYLNDHQYKTKFGNKWTRRSVFNVLQNLIYTGHTKNTYGNIIKSKLYPSIISLNEFKQLWSTYKKGPSYPNPHYKRYQSSGIISCPICNAKWAHASYKVKGKRYAYYKADHLTDCTNRRQWFTKDFIDDVLNRALFLAYTQTDEAKELYKKQRHELYRETEGSRKVANTYQEEHEKLEKRRSRILKAISEKVLTAHDAKQSLEKIDAKKNEIEQRLNEIERKYEIYKDSEDVFKLYTSHQLQEYWSNSELEKKKILKESIKEASYLHGRLTVVFAFGTKITLNLDTYQDNILMRLGPASQLYDSLKAS